MKTLKLFLFFCLICSLQLQSADHPITMQTKQNSDLSVTFTCIKTVPATYTLSLKFTMLENAYTPSIYPVITYSQGDLFTLRPINPKRCIKYAYKFSYILGDIKAVPDTMFTYLLPFKNGKEVKAHELFYVKQRYFNQLPPRNWKDFLFKFNTPDTVYAIRKGIVIEVKDENNPDSLSTHYHSKANIIMVQHADGTIAHYTGFAKDGVFVQVGDVVYPQTALGILGYYDADKDYQLRLSIYHLYEEYQLSDNQSSEKKKQNYYEYINPYFITEEGVTRLSNNKKYKAVSTNNLIEKEMSKKEIKKLQKQHLK